MGGGHGPRPEGRPYHMGSLETLRAENVAMIRQMDEQVVKVTRMAEDVHSLLEASVAEVAAIRQAALNLDTQIKERQGELSQQMAGADAKLGELKETQAKTAADLQQQV